LAISEFKIVSPERMQLPCPIYALLIFVYGRGNILINGKRLLF
jgi:hypothetical protein